MTAPAGEQVVIARRFNGPPNSAQGGYAAGVVAAYIDGPAEVTLRRPPPLETPLTIARQNGQVQLLHDGALIAEGGATTIDLAVPEPPTFAQAETAAQHSPCLASENDFTGCFVCGRGRQAPDGFRVFPGPVGADGVYACPWVPHVSLADDAGNVSPLYLWSALDCPSGIALNDVAPLVSSLLGRFAVQLTAPVRAGERCILIGWCTGQDGRKLHSASALFTEAGTLCGVARATWIALRA